MASIEDILARAKPRVEVVSICLVGDLRAEHKRLVEELERVQSASAGRKKMIMFCMLRCTSVALDDCLLSANLVLSNGSWR
jgi:hypothetical protein